MVVFDFKGTHSALNGMIVHFLEMPQVCTIRFITLLFFIVKNRKKSLRVLSDLAHWSYNDII